jgi:type I restriction enzyme S subunit
MILPLPPISEQCRIAVTIESVFSTIGEIERNKTDLLSAVTAAKSKILSLAVHGKLVPQDPTDEPASVLLERIRKEREKLVKQGKIKRCKAENAIVRGGDNCYYGKLPQNWAICTLSTIGQIVGGGTPKTDMPSYWSNGTIPWITPADLSGYQMKFIENGVRMITENGLTSSSAQIIPKGSVLFSSRAPIGYTVIAATDVCTNQGFKSIVPYIEGLSDFIYYFLRTQVDEIHLRASGTTFKEISGAEMGKTLIFLPPLEEQKRITIAIEKFFEWLDIIFKTITKGY